jgi:hypothetical protein
MSQQKLTPRCVLAFVALDVLFNPLVMVAFLGLFRIEGAHSATIVLPLLVLVKVAANSLFLWTELAPYERATSRSGRASEELLASADRALQALPRRFGIFYATSWSVTYALAFVRRRGHAGRRGLVRRLRLRVPALDHAHDGRVVGLLD